LKLRMRAAHGAAFMLVEGRMLGAEPALRIAARRLFRPPQPATLGGMRKVRGGSGICPGRGNLYCHARA
jgi:hypothetical protein